MGGEVMTASEVAAALVTRWPHSDYLHIREAPLTSDRSGRKLDVLVVALWKSRGLERDGVEIKVSMSDLRRELADPTKADEWFQHVHRFWVAMPMELARKAKAEVPSSWGVMGVQDGSTRIVQRPTVQSNPKVFSWSPVVGLMRAAADAGPAALQAQFAAGVVEGKRRAEATASRHSADDVRDRMLELTRRVEVFHRLTGIDISGSWRPIEHEATIVHMARSFHADPAAWAKLVERSVESLRGTANSIEREMEALMALVPPTPGGES